MNPKITIFVRMIREMDGFDEFIEEVQNKGLPSYKPVRRSDSDRLSPNTQKDNWVFDSGVRTENARLLKILTGESNDAS